ncbi:MAG: BON domain-containing protein [Chloroflexia bacterium]
MKHITSWLIAGLLTAPFSNTFGQDSGASKAPASDNTKVNKRDRSASERTADQAKETTSDRDIMQKIRKAIVEEKSLSTYAHNVKVISEHGKVTLKGPVHTDEERKTVEGKAVEVAGVGNVTNQISVKGDKGNTK